MQRIAKFHKVSFEQFSGDWTDEMCIRDRCMVNVADRWRERNVWYPGRSVRNVLKGITIIVR